MTRIGFVLALASGAFAQTAINGSRDLVLQPAPSSPSSGKIRIYGDSGSGRLGCLDSSGGNCAPGGTPAGSGGSLQYNNGGAFGGIAPADDNLLVGNGAAWQTKTLPACADSGGNHLNYDAATNTWSCGTSSNSLPGGSSGQLQYNNGGAFGGIAPADDSLLVGNGAAWQTKALPTCADSAGKHLNYDPATNTFSCGTSYAKPTTTDTRTFQGAVCQSSTAASPFSLAAANAGIPSCATGTNTNTATLHFIAGSTSYAQQHVPLPKTWSGTVDAGIRWRAAATSGTVVWGIKTVAVPDGMGMDQAFGASPSTVSTTAPGTTLTLKTDTIAGIGIANATVGTSASQPATCTVGSVFLASDTNQWYGCLVTNTWTAVGGVELFFGLYRQGSGADTMTGDAELFQLQVKVGSAGPAVY